MRLFLELTKRSFQRQLSYRAATIAGLITNFFFGLLRAAVLIALFAERQEVEGISLIGAITYTAITQATIGYLSLFSWYDIMRSVYTGDVASDLLKPMNYYTFWLAQDFGRAVAAFFTRGLIIIFAYAIFVRISYPQTLIQWAALIAALILSWLVSFSWRFIINLAAFWIPNATGIGRFFFSLSLLLSGFLMPLRFYPEWVIQFSAFTPFPSTVNAVVEIYLGVLSTPEIITTLTVQVFWVVLLFIIGQIILRAGTRRLVILGG